MSFSQHTGQKRVAGQLRGSLERGRLAHAYLFIGPRDSGKRAMAVTLAQAVNCEKLDGDACGRCVSCRRIGSKTHPDVYWVQPESKSRRIAIEQIRDFIRAVNLKAGEARIKVGLIVDADRMGDEAANAFLKTLEEPPANTIMILLTAEPQRLLPTILSRCLKLSFGPVAGAAGSPYREKILPLLAQFAAQREARVPASYQLLAAVTGILKQVRAKIEEEQQTDRYDDLEADARKRFEDQMAARIEGEYRAAREQVLEEIYRWFGDLVLSTVGAHEKPPPAAKDFTYEQACAGLDAIERVRDSLQRNVAETFALEVGFLNLAR